MTAKQVRAQCTQEFKLEAVRQVLAGQAIGVVAKVLGIPKASLLIRPLEVLSRIANMSVLEVAHDALWVLLQHGHVIVGRFT